MHIFLKSFMCYAYNQHWVHMYSGWWHLQSTLILWTHKRCTVSPLRWPHNEHDCVSNHQPHDCLHNCSFRRRSKKRSKLHVTGLCAGNSPVTAEFPAQRPVTWKMFPFDNLIMSQIYGWDVNWAFWRTLQCYVILYIDQHLVYQLMAMT